MAIQFNGSTQGISLGQDVPGTGNQSVLSMCCWVRPSNTTANMTVASFAVGAPPGTTGNARMSMELSNSVDANVQIRGRSANGDSVRIVTSDAPQFEAYEWFHLTGVIDYTSSLHFIYINGGLVKVGPPGTAYTQPTTANNNSKNAGIGANALVANQFFNGLIEDFRLYNRFISEQEAETIWSARGTDGILNGLVYRFPFTGVEGAVVTDPVPELTGSRAGLAIGAPTYAGGLIVDRRRVWPAVGSFR